ncbi:golgi-body localization protein domain-containing protein [Flammula alnicola]|nr:golgi-body localization protein domain-containing protein [Flammula alnicola]
MSDHIRVRSISLRSIRGIYFRKGARTWRVERVSYVWSSVQGSRLTIKIDGVSLHIAKDEGKEVNQTPRRHNRNLTLADLNPSPLARHAWRLISTITTFLEPYFRPLIRSYVIACLRVGIQWLPKITQALSFDLHSMVITFAEVPGAKVVIEEIGLHTALALTYLEHVPDVTDIEKIPSRPDTRAAQGMGVGGDSRGKATLSLKICNVIGTMPHSPLKDSLNFPFLQSPGMIDLGISVKFSPKEGAIDPQGLEISLKIGECSAKVDLLNILLDKALPKKPQTLAVIHPSLSSPILTSGDTPLLSSTTLGSQASPVLPSPAQSFASSLFSPSSFFSPSDLMSSKLSFFSPNSTKMLSPRSPRSPASPFLQAISASMRPRRRYLVQPSAKLKDHKDKSTMLILHSVKVSAETGPYKAHIKDIDVELSLSDPSSNRLHKEHLGCRQKTDSCDSNAYALQITLQSNHHVMRLARLGLISFQALAFQWPTPFLVPTPFMGNDPNASFLAIHVKLAGVHLTDRIHDLQRLLNTVKATEKTDNQDPPYATPRSQSFPIPLARTIYDADKGEKHRAIELRSNEYKHSSTAIRRFFPAASSVQSLHWNFALSINLEPILVRVRLGEPNLHDPSVLSIGSVEIAGVANASVAIIDNSTLAFDLSVVLETICIELWHPISVSPSSTTSRPRFLHLPTGLSAKATVARFVIFITAPDISPHDNLELSRGFALRTTTSLEYCCLRANQDHWFNNLQRSQKRAKLLLPAEALVDAIVAAKELGYPGDKSASVKMQLSNFVFRAAVATQYEPDDPAIVGRDDIPDSSKDVIRIDSAQLDACLSCKTTTSGLQRIDACDISVQIPLIRAYFQLVHAYSILLGLQTVGILRPPRPTPPTVSTEQPKSDIVVVFHGNVTAVQALLTLPTQKLVVRMDGLSGHLSSGVTPRIKWNKTTCFVALPSQNNRWEDPSERKWDEFVTLQAWEISFTPLAGSLCIAVDGDGGLVRIPYGFVLADLVQDVVISMKAMKHMAHMASAGCYSEMPDPEPEGPKSVPHLTIRLGCLCAEAQDDPFETRLGLIWRTGAEAVKQRIDREEAFKVKVAAVLSAEPELSSTTNTTKVDPEHEYQFGSKHSVSIDEARKRLDDVHALDWTLRLEKEKDQRSKDESSILHKLCGTFTPLTSDALLEVMTLPKPSSETPLIRAMLQNLCLTISPPTFSIDRVVDIMHELGGGLPRDTKFSLLVPLHVHFTLSSLHITLRDYPLPLLRIPERTDATSISWTFDTDLIIGEEMGTELSVDWVDCPIIEAPQALHGEAPFSILVPKTIMPTLSNSPRDSSPTLGFWDKMRLVFHWTVKVSFSGDVRLYMKGTRDPHNISDTGSGFVLCWQGNPEIRVGYDNFQKELIQVMSDGMLIAVPNLESFSRSPLGDASPQKSKPFQKVCARLSSGVRYGIGLILERSCGPECLFCTGTAFDRKCRYFSFHPHYEVKLEKKPSPPMLKGPDDSYNGFRSDFIHLSLSLACSTKAKDRTADLQPSNLYLTPKIFAHFWSWCSLFDGALTLPIRQGNYHPSRPISPKLGRHLATLKYRISLPNLYFMHGYIDDARETWVDGITPWVGLKGKIDELQVDMHQREEESTVPGPVPDTTRVMRKKPFYAAEVIMKGLELRAMLATFLEPMKQNVEMTAPPQRSNYRKHANLPTTSSTSVWHDLDDFVELDWSPPVHPTLHLLPLAACPHFTYFKRNETLSGSQQSSKFGSEHSHICLLGKEPSVPKTQINIASARAKELRKMISGETEFQTRKASLDKKALRKMVTLLEEYIAVLKEVEIKPDTASQQNSAQNHYMPSDIVSSDEWAQFDNVYQIHCPSIFMDSAIRDIMMQYYYCSRDRRGFEYHMAARAVKFIRDQANAVLAVGKEEESLKDRGPSNTAQIAASALRKMLRGDSSAKISVDVAHESNSHLHVKVDPLDGWAEGVSLTKSHCCLLLRPQIILSGEAREDKCIVAAAQAKLQSFAIMDLLNLYDPVSGKVMSRNYTSLSGLQTFAPTNALSTSNGSVPLEVLIDLRCESDAFERLVPQTEAIFHYDKFNRLRLRNNTTSIVTKASTTQNSAAISDSHLQDQTDVIRVHIPRFTVSANTEHFQAISTIVTNLLLFSDPAHKTRLDKLETLIFTYDFTDLASAANVVSSLQCRLRDALETERLTRRNWRRLEEEDGRLSLLQLKAHIFLLSEELNLLFDSIKMAQDRFDDQTDQKSALLLHASSSEISWRMLDARRNLLSKLVVTNINFNWLSRQDSSTVNHLTIGNLSAFDGSRYALWTEILSKYDDPPNHPLLKRGLFLLANWTVLAPVGGITIYETFELSLHPLRLQIDSKVGRRIMEYVWPDRARRKAVEESEKLQKKDPPEITVKSPTSPGRSSVDSPRGLHVSPRPADSNGKPPMPSLRRLGSSRSFTDLKSARENSFLSPPAFLKRTHSSDSINFISMLEGPSGANTDDAEATTDILDKKHDAGDAQVMKTRSSQKSFILVRISSLHLLLSVVKEGSFECHDAKIKTRELEYRNQTWSFEELVNQFIPSNMNWRGWVKMAFHQPLVPVLPVARELLSKTKWISRAQPHDSPLRLLHPSILATDDDQRLNWMHREASRKTEISSKSSWRSPLRNNKDPPSITSLPLTAEPESMESSEGPSSPNRPAGRKRMKSLFTKSSRHSSKNRPPDKSEDVLKGNS